MSVEGLLRLFVIVVSVLRETECHSGWFPQVSGWYPITNINEQQAKEIANDWNPGKGRTCQVLGNARWNQLREVDNPSSLVIVGSGLISINYIDDSWIFNIHVEDRICVPPYKPIAMIFTQSGSPKIYRYRQGQTNAAESSCPDLDVTVCPMPHHFPRKLPKPVHEFFFAASYKPKVDDLSIITCCTVDRLLRIRQMAEIYQGPISVAVYITKEKMEEDFLTLMKYYLKYPIMQKYIDVHLVFDDGFVPYKTDDRPFPINILRTTALKFVRTHFIMFLEADFITNTNFRISPYVDEVKLKLLENPKQIFILPGFMSNDPRLCAWDIELSDVFPKTKQELLDHWLSPKTETGIVPLSEILDSHKPLSFDKWKNENTIFSFTPQGYFEPYYISTRDYPVFGEIMIGCGKDKIVHFEELRLAGYSISVLPDSFIVHLDSTGMGSGWCSSFGAQFPKDEANSERARWEWAEGGGYKAQPMVWWDALQSRITNAYSSPIDPVVLHNNPDIPSINTAIDEAVRINDEKMKAIKIAHEESLVECEKVKNQYENLKWQFKLYFFLSIALFFTGVFCVIKGVFTKKSPSKNE